MWFTPLYTTDEMKKKTGNPDFEYEISCDQMCGRGHYSMKGDNQGGDTGRIYFVEGQTESNYAQVMKDQAPAGSCKNRIQLPLHTAAKVKANSASKAVVKAD